MDVSLQSRIRCVHRSSAFGLSLFNIFINSLDEDIKLVLVKSAADTKLETQLMFWKAESGFPRANCVIWLPKMLT